MTRPLRKILVTGASGLIGSEAVAHFDGRGAEVVGLDNNMRADFFGEKGDTRWNLERLNESTSRFRNFAVDIRDRGAVLAFLDEHRPDAIIHCAAQPSHDLAARRPFDDFDVNACGTLNLLEAARRFATDSPFVFMSTNKVYGDAPNRIPLVELRSRYDFARPEDQAGIDETLSIDQCLHSLFGASKAAADLLVQEYGKYFGMPTVCFRGGCLTGPNHSGVELHGFLNHLVNVAAQDGTYKIFGYGGKQVRDQIHSCDVVRAMELYIENPRPGEVYNLGGGRDSNASILECLEMISLRLGRPVKSQYIDEPRRGDHVCYISNMAKFKSHYPRWRLTRHVEDILDEMLEQKLRSRESQAAVLSTT
ncbi:MAG TPA: NAD-dependent epimerase/dehydratase family protein [Pirellulales bacterium]|nr:NAD-dependent epimerase/dehydratase family protein [Pirellulales bacterium]